MKRRRKKEKKKQRSRCEKKKKKKEEEERKLVIRQDTEQWVPFIAKNYKKCYLNLFSVFNFGIS